MNQCNFYGRLVRDPDLRYTNNGKAVCSFTLAVEDGYKKNKRVEYIKIIVWGKSGKAAAKYLFKGKPIIVENGILRIRNVKKDGKKYVNPEIHARKITYLPGGKKEKTDKEITENNTKIEDDLNEGEMPF